MDLLHCKVNIICEAGTVHSRACELQACATPVVEHHRSPPFLCYAGAHPLAVALTTAPCKHALVDVGDMACVVTIRYERQQTAPVEVTIMTGQCAGDIDAGIKYICCFCKCTVLAAVCSEIVRLFQCETLTALEA